MKPAQMTDEQMIDAVQHLYQGRAVAVMAIDVSKEEYQAIIAARDKQWADLIDTWTVECVVAEFVLAEELK